MAYEIIGPKISIKATTAITTQFALVKLDANGQIVLGTSASDCVGVCQEKPSTGDPAMVCLSGSVTKVACGGSFNAGGDVMCGANGLAVAAVTGGFVIGKALSAGAVSTLATIIFQPRASKVA